MARLVLCSHLILVVLLLALASRSEAGPACAKRHEGTDLCAMLCTEKWGWVGRIMGTDRWGPVMTRNNEDPKSVARKYCKQRPSNSTSSSAPVATSTTLLPIGNVGSDAPTTSESSGTPTETPVVPTNSFSEIASATSSTASISSSVPPRDSFAQRPHASTSAFNSASTFVTTINSQETPESQTTQAFAPEHSSSDTPPPPATTPKPSSSTTPAPAPTTSVTPTTQRVAVPATTTPTSTGGSSGGDIDQYLSAHNNFRAQHGANPLTWSDELASKAQEWANKCQFKHSGGSLGPYGENLAAGTGSGYNIAAAIKSWTDESSEYDPNNPQPSHFTQVVWKSTTQLGCAVALCDGIFDPSYGKAKFYVCEYSPAGNVIGQFSENVQP